MDVTTSLLLAGLIINGTIGIGILSLLAMIAKRVKLYQ